MARFQRPRQSFLLFEAFKKLSDSIPDVQLVLIGRGGCHRQEILHWIDTLGLASKVHLVGYRDKDYT